MHLKAAISSKSFLASLMKLRSVVYGEPDFMTLTMSGLCYDYVVEPL